MVFWQRRSLGLLSRDNGSAGQAESENPCVRSFAARSQVPHLLAVHQHGKQTALPALDCPLLSLSGCFPLCVFPDPVGHGARIDAQFPGQLQLGVPVLSDDSDGLVPELVTVALRADQGGPLRSDSLSSVTEGRRNQPKGSQANGLPVFSNCAQP